MQAEVLHALIKAPHLHLHNLIMHESQPRSRQLKQAAGGQLPRYAPPLSSPCGHRSAFRRRADGNVAAVSHSQHVLTLTAAAAWCSNMAVSKVTLTFDLESGVWVTWATSVPILVFLDLSVLDLGKMYGRQTDVRQKHRLMPRLLGVGP